MMKKSIFFIFGFIVFLGINLFAQLNISGYYKNYTGLLTDNANNYSLLQNTVSLKFDISNKNSVLFINPYMIHIPNQTPSLGLREAYLDLYFDFVDVRIGKQQIIWGKGDGVFITDVVSPKDLSNFLLPEFDEIRMGVTALKTDFYLGDNTLSVVWIPIFTPTNLPQTGSIWLPKSSFSVAPTYDYSKKDIKTNLANSEFFAKYSVLSSFIDWEFVMGNMWDDDLTMHIQKTSSGLTIIPQHHRLNMYGGSFSSSIGGYVFRGEGAYYKGKYFASNDSSLLDGVVSKDYLNYLLGLDFSWWDFKISAQYIQKIILNYDSMITQDEQDNMITLLVKRDLFRETLHLEWFSYLGLNKGDALHRPKISYDFNDNLKINIGMNIFTGSEGSFGQYTNNDMIFLEVKYSF